MKKKKNKFFLFLCSFIPGAGDMYLGFMKTGVSLISAFVLVIMISVCTGISALSLVLVVIWMYSFFHANNLGSLNDEEFSRMEDTYLFGLNEEGMASVKDFSTGKYRKGLAVILILLGISMVWRVIDDLLYDILGREFYHAYIANFTISNHNVSRLIIGVVVIWLGIKLIQGKKIELDRREAAEEVRAAEDVKAEEGVKAAEEVRAAEGMKAAEEVKAAEDVKATEEVRAAESVKATEEVNVVEAVNVAEAAGNSVEDVEMRKEGQQMGR